MRRLMPRSRRLALALLAAAPLLAGCGGGEPSPVLDRDGVLHLKLDEFRIRPAAIVVESDTFPMHVHLVAKNTGRLTHNVKIEDVDPDAEQGTDAQPTVYGGTDMTAQPGQTVSGDVTLWPGTYRMACTIGNHENLGMYGTLVVKRKTS